MIERGHSHNDYWRNQPFLEAVGAGLNSVEVDVFLVEGRLLVGHDEKELRPEKTLERLYLQPLSRRIRETGGRVHRGQHSPFWVLVDFKTDGEAAYPVFARLLQGYPSLQWVNRKVRFVASGNRPVSSIVRDKGRTLALDGRWNDLEKGYSTEMMPWVSEAWRTHFQWTGNGPMPASERTKLTDMAARVGQEGRKIRFWGQFDVPSLWAAQWEAGVHLINTDRPAALRDWIHQQLNPSAP